MKPIFTCFYTIGTFYEQEAARLRRSLDRLGLAHDLRGIPSAGDWCKNAALTARHIATMLAAYPDRPVVQLDADAVVWRAPALFHTLDCDVALHRRRGTEWLNGTVYFAPTHGARRVSARYLQLIEGNPGCTNEQVMLGKAIEELAGQFKLSILPASYCFIPDIMASDLAEGEQTVISHFQASRTAKAVGGEHEARRKQWILEWEKMEAEIAVS